MLKRLLLTGVIVTFSTQAMAAAIVPHRAVYDLEMLRSTQGANLGGVSGRMAYEVTGSACDGWTVSMRLVNNFEYKEGNSRLIDMQSSSWETGDGKEMNYSEKAFVDNKPDTEKRLSVSREEPNGEGQGKITLPKEQSFSIAGEAIFSMHHQLRLMDAAKKGETRDVSVVYDGSDDTKPLRAISTIGKKIAAGASTADNANPSATNLAKLPSWPVSIGYYPSEDSKDDTPLYQISFDMYENGVSTGLIMDYGNYALSGKLAHLELLKPEACN